MGREHEQEQEGARRSRAPRRKFSREFKRDAVEMVLTSGRPITEVAEELGLYDSTLGKWVRQARVDRGEREGTRARTPRVSVSSKPSWHRSKASVTCSNDQWPSG